MATLTAVTHRKKSHRRGVLDSEPIPTPTFRSQNSSALKKEAKFYVDVDAQALVNWLNAASGTKSFDRVRAIMCEVGDLKRAFQSNAARFLTPGPVNAVTRKARDLQAENTKIMRALDARLRALDKALTVYVFRPRAYWFWPDRDWLLNLCADDIGQEFFVQSGHRLYGEADAVMSILRLTTKGQFNRVRLCTNCGKRWRYAAKSHYKFCSRECREQFYTSSPDYHARKAENQRNYRSNVRDRIANEDAVWKGKA